MAGSKLNQKQEANQLKTDVEAIGKTVGKHDNQITNIQTLTILGFIIALVTVFGIVIAAIAFFSTEMHQINIQTQLLQQMNDKLDK